MAVFVKLLPFFQNIPFKLSIGKVLTNLKPFNNLAKKNISDVCILKKWKHVTAIAQAVSFIIFYKQKFKYIR